MLTVTACVSASTCTFDFESENGNSLNQMYRSEASGGLTVLLKEGQVLVNYFEVSRSSNCSARIDNVAYSNDGAGDIFQLSLNGTELGEFRTAARTGNGDNWNIFLNTGAFGNYTQLLVGRYTLSLTVLEADIFGVEIDKTTLAVECTGNTECPEVESTASTNSPSVGTGSGSGGSGSGDSLSAGAIIGIVFGAVTTVIAIPGCIVALIILWNKWTG